LKEDIFNDPMQYCKAVDLYLIADYFELPTLAALACAEVRRLNEYRTQCFQNNRDLMSDDEIFGTTFLDEFMPQAHRAFAIEDPSGFALQKAFRHFFWVTRYVPLKYLEVHNRLASVPSFAVAVLRDMAEPKYGVFKNLPETLPRTCLTCGREPLNDGTRFFAYLLPEDVLEGARGYCNFCIPEAGPLEFETSPVGSPETSVSPESKRPKRRARRPSRVS
jgi:hypothetical protein